MHLPLHSSSQDGTSTDNHSPLRISSTFSAPCSAPFGQTDTLGFCDHLILGIEFHTSSASRSSMPTPPPPTLSHK